VLKLHFSDDPPKELTVFSLKLEDVTLKPWEKMVIDHGKMLISLGKYEGRPI
jgi:hypothetical protein